LRYTSEWEDVLVPNRHDAVPPYRVDPVSISSRTSETDLADRQASVSRSRPAATAVFLHCAQRMEQKVFYRTFGRKIVGDRRWGSTCHQIRLEERRQAAFATAYALPVSMPINAIWCGATARRFRNI
jgi:hypothetical protein